MSDRHPTVTFTVTEADQLAFAWEWRVRRYWIGGALVIAAACGWPWLFGGGGNWAVPLTLLPWPVLAPMLDWVRVRDGVRAAFQADLLHDTQHTLTVSDGGLEELSPTLSVVPWSRVGRVWSTRSSLLVPVAGQGTVLVPRRAFADEGAIRAFREAIAARRAASPTAPQPAVPTDFDAEFTWDVTFEHEERKVLAHRWLRAQNPARSPYGASLISLAGATIGGVVWYLVAGPALAAIWATGAALAAIRATPQVSGAVDRRRIEAQARRAQVDGPGRLWAGPDLVVVVQGNGFASLQWASLTTIAEDADHVFLLLPNHSGWCIAKQAFGSPEQATAFVAQATGWLTAAREAATLARAQAEERRPPRVAAPRPTAPTRDLNPYTPPNDR